MQVEQIIGDLIADAEGCTETQPVRLRLLEHVRRLAPFESAMLMPIASSEPATSLAKSLELSGVYRLNQKRFTRELARAHAVGDASGAYIDIDVYGPAERARLAFFAEIIEPQGITSRMVAHLRFRGAMIATVHLCRHGRGRRFASRELEIVRRIVPVLGLTYTTLPMAARAGGQLDALSRRESQIVACVRRGYQNKEIALVLHVSPNTVRNALVGIFRKVGVSTRAALAARAERAGI